MVDNEDASRNKFLSGSLKEWNEYQKANYINTINLRRVTFSAENTFRPFDNRIFNCDKIDMSNCHFDRNCAIDVNSSNFIKDVDVNLSSANLTVIHPKIIFSNENIRSVILDEAAFGNGGDIYFSGENLKSVSFIRTDFSRISESDPRHFNIVFISCHLKDFKFILSEIKTTRSSQFNATVNITFHDVTLDASTLIFENSKLGSINFSGCRIKNIQKLSLFNSTIGNPFNLSIFSPSSCIPDFRDVIVNGNVELDGFTCKTNESDIQLINNEPSKCRSLKSFAENNKDHDSALYFHSLEMRSKRERLDRANKAIDIFFDSVCSYGRCFIKPAKLLLLEVLIFWLVYILISFFYVKLTYSFSFKSLLFSMSNNPLLLYFSKTMFDGNFINNLPCWVILIFIIQNIFSMVFLFLIGLGLRNRFRF